MGSNLYYSDETHFEAVNDESTSFEDAKARSGIFPDRAHGRVRDHSPHCTNGNSANCADHHELPAGCLRSVGGWAATKGTIASSGNEQSGICTDGYLKTAEHRICQCRPVSLCSGQSKRARRGPGFVCEFHEHGNAAGARSTG